MRRTGAHTPARSTSALSFPASSIVWTVAEASGTAPGWDAAAEVLERERATCAGDDCLDAAYSLLLARKNALVAEPIQPPPGEDTPPLPPRVQSVIDAIDEYVSLADPSDPELAGIRFTAASATARWRQPDAIARLEALLREHRDDPTAEYSANVLLDLLLRAERIDEARAWIAELLADEVFLAGKDQLRQTLERLREMTAD